MKSFTETVQVQLYSPRRPSLDPAEVFLWLMAVGTIVCASYWSAWSARESDIELDKLLKVASDYVDTEEKGSSDTVDIGITLILLFIVTASCFLVVLYKFMSNLFVEVLVVLFSIGGVQGLQHAWWPCYTVWTVSGLAACLVALLYWWFRNAGDSYIRVPFIGAVSHLTLAVSPFCLAFASVWAVYRNICFAWIGQDILGMSLMISVFQIVRVPNLKVGSILSCAFLYDAFWVFVSKTLFHESVMIMVARGHRSGGIPMLLKFPRMLDRWGGYSIVGFGDILLPGLVLALSLRYDWLCRKNLQAGYFLWAVMAYGLGLFSTYLALNFMDGHGQPALLYVVPLTLGTLLTLAKSRGDLDVQEVNHKRFAHTLDQAVSEKMQFFASSLKSCHDQTRRT